jgi:hypothetical protein
MILFSDTYLDDSYYGSIQNSCIGYYNTLVGSSAKKLVVII